MTIHLHIDRLILDGISVPHAQRPLLQAAIEAELGQLLAAGSLAPELQAGGAIPRISAGEMQLAPDRTPTQMGHQIAQAVYRGIGS